jgi:hypothetical protein
MQLRFLLIAATVLGIGAIAISQFVVRPHIQSIVGGRDRNLQQYQSEQRVHNETKGTLKQAEAKQEETEKKLLAVRHELALANTKAAEQQKVATRLEGELTSVRQQLAAAKAELAPWLAMPIPVDQVKAVIAEVKRLRATNEVIVEERRILASLLKNPKYRGIPGTDVDPVLPPGLRGHVLVVDPKYDFVVLDIGAGKGVEPRGKLLVARQGQLVAKVSVSRIEQDRCIANVIPGWKLDELREGDQVLY